MFTFFVSVVIFYLCGQVYAGERKISTYVNPGCDEWCANRSVIFIHNEATGEDDTLHHIWDFTFKPTILVALTPKNTSLTIDWKKFLWDGGEGSVTFSQTPTYVFSVLFDKILEFNDIDNTGEFNGNYTQMLNTENLNWNLTNINETTKSAEVTIEGRNYTDSSTNRGRIRFLLGTYGKKEHSTLLPHLYHTTNASQISVILDDLPTLHPQSRFALRLVIVNSDPSNTTLDVKRHKSLDDEHSPGIFTVAEVLSDTNPNTVGGYLQWRTVAYTSEDRIMTNTTDIHNYNIDPTSISETNATVLYSLYGINLEEMSINSFNVSFGSKDDGFYQKTNYVSWTLLCGLGQPAEEEFSLLVLLVVGIGLGLPAILIIVSIFCIVGRRISRNRDDLFLSH